MNKHFQYYRKCKRYSELKLPSICHYNMAGYVFMSQLTILNCLKIDSGIYMLPNFTCWTFITLRFFKSPVKIYSILTQWYLCSNLCTEWKMTPWIRSKDKWYNLEGNIHNTNKTHTHTWLGFQRRDKEIEEIFKKIMAETFPKVLKGINSQIQDQQTPNKLKAEKSTLRHIIVKVLKTNKNRKSWKQMGFQKGGWEDLFQIRK